MGVRVAREDEAMSDTPTMAAGPEHAAATHPAREVKAALTDFLQEVAAQNAELRTKLQHHEERLTMLDRKHARLSASPAARPSLSTRGDPEPLHRKAFAAYLRSGADDALRGVALEGKGMRTAVNAEGGYLVDPETAEAIQGVLHSAASVRAIANVVTVEATSFDVLVDHSELGTGWATETGPQTETATPLIDRISIPLHELSAMPKASQRLLDDAAFDIEGWLASRIADRFARAEAAAFISGDGVDKPKGFLSHEKVVNTSWAWGKLGYIPSGAAGAFRATNGADAIVDLVYALDAPYRAGAVFVMNSKTAGTVRKMKDGDGRFLWSDGLAAAEPARLMGYPVLVAEDMPDVAANSFAVAFGDFRAGYTIAERPDLRVLRDPFSAKPHVLFYATRRVGGDVADFKAIKLLRFATS